MKLLKKIGTLAGGALALNVALFVINILQAGERKPDGRSMTEILGVDPESATWEDIEKLNRSETMQLFYAAKAPKLEDMDGEYQAKLLSGGVLGSSTAYFTHYVFPTGMLTLNTEWIGKAFKPSDGESYGYNIFRNKKTGDIMRCRRMRTSIGPTTIGTDLSDSLHLDYGPDNPGLIHSMHDEIRRVNDDLFICAGYMGFSGGPLNPGPFVVIGPPAEWVGLD